MKTDSIRWTVFSCILFALISIGEYIARVEPEVLYFYTSIVGGGILAYLMRVFSEE